MTIEFQCGECGRTLRTADDKAGRRCKCPECGTILDVPAESAGESPGVYDAEEIPFVAGESGTPTDEDRRICPACGEEISVRATECRHCGEDLVGDASGRGRRKRSRGGWQPTVIDAGEVVSVAWERFKDQMGVAIGLIVVGGMVNMMASMPQNVLGQMLENGAVGRDMLPVVIVMQLGFVALGFVVQSWLSVGTAIAMLKISRGQAARIEDLFTGGPYLLRMMGNSIVFGLGMVIGLLLLVVPGILFVLTFWPFLYVLVDRDERGLDPLFLSREITSGNWGSIFLLCVISVVVNFLGLMCLCVGMLFTVPLTYLYFGVAYDMMTGGSGGSRSRRRSPDFDDE
ncbi:MAG: hypothetical protein KDA58_15900 [Planctomycetaceae bacterium]|nr:hypothetical protein [Planctomycetaceae bacterium]